jgi:hypothetical protein
VDLPLERLFALVRATGRNIEQLPIDGWWARAEQRGLATSFADLRLAQASGAAGLPRYDSTATHAALARLDVRFPALDAPTLAAWIDDLERVR